MMEHAGSPFGLFSPQDFDQLWVVQPAGSCLQED